MINKIKKVLGMTFEKQEIPVTTVPVVKNKKTVKLVKDGEPRDLSEPFDETPQQSGIETVVGILDGPQLVIIPDELTKLAAQMQHMAQKESQELRLKIEDNSVKIEEYKRHLVSESQKLMNAENKLLRAKVEHLEMTVAVLQAQAKINEMIAMNLVDSERANVVISRSDGYRHGLRNAYLRELGYDLNHCSNFSVKKNEISFDFYQPVMAKAE